MTITHPTSDKRINDTNVQPMGLAHVVVSCLQYWTSLADAKYFLLIIELVPPASIKRH